MRHNRHDALTRAVKELIQKGRAGIPLSRESELELLSAYCTAPNAITKGVLRDEFLGHYLYLVSSEVKHVQKRGDNRSIDELMALGTKGLLYALEQVEKFVEEEGIDELDFAVYATTRIKQALVERKECKCHHREQAESKKVRKGNEAEGILLGVLAAPDDEDEAKLFKAYLKERRLEKKIELRDSFLAKHLDVVSKEVEDELPNSELSSKQLVARGTEGLLRAFEHFAKNAEDAGEDFAEFVKFPIYARPWVRMAVRPSYKEYKELVKRGKRKKMF